MDSQGLQQQMASTRSINKWSMILSIATVVLVVLFYSTIIPAAAIAEYNNSAPSAALAGLGWFGILSLLLAFVAGIANFVVKIIAAVKNNNYAIKEVYRKSGQGDAAGILSILAVFFLGLIFSIIIFVQTKNVLQQEVEIED
ncbi:MAG: hypothetical protein LBM27_00940 [Lactobacillaceae bacterium]|jgi:hypothetical protein|nr:hypothetical protein [Lactobacillaceae bacterium]